MLTAAEGTGLTAAHVRLIIGQVCVHAAMSGMRIAAPLLVLTLGYSKIEVGIVVSLFALTQIFLSVPIGRLADRGHFKHIVGWSVLACVGGAAMAALWPIYPVVCVSAMLCGGAVGAAAINMQRHMARSAANATQLRQIFSWLSIAPAAANFIGPFAAGLMIDHAGYRAAFLMLAMLPIVTWLLVRNVPEPAPAETESQAKGSLLDLWREPAFRRLVLINGVVSAAWDSHSFIVPVLGHDRGLSASVIGAIVGSFALAAIVSRLAMPRLSKVLREWHLIGGAMLAAALIYALYPFTTTALAMGLCSALLGTFLGLVNPLVMTLLHQVAPSHRHGEALAIRLVVINVSSVSTPLLFGLVGGAIGVSAAFWAMALALGLGSKMTMLLRGGEKGGG